MSAAVSLSAGKLLTTTAPDATAAQARAIARDHFGIVAQAHPLTSERDQNFRLVAEDGQVYVLKIANAAEDAAVVNLQTMALQHVALADPELPVPRVVASSGGGHEVVVTLDGGGRHVVRVLTYLSGVPSSSTASSPQRTHNAAVCLARLDLALHGFEHPAADHELLWDAKHAGRLVDLVRQIEGSDRRRLAETFLETFERHAAPARAHLRAQVIHNDFNPHNVLVDAQDPAVVAGIIDFGDMVRSPLVNDIAVAASYQARSDGDGLEASADFVAAYHAILPLTAAEIDVLFDLIAVRHVMTVAITEWRARRYPENSAYILKNNPRAWAGLRDFARIPRSQAQARLRLACRME